MRHAKLNTMGLLKQQRAAGEGVNAAQLEAASQVWESYLTSTITE